MAEPGRHLHVVDAETGEQLEECPNCAAYRDQLTGMEKDIRAWRARYAAATQDKEKAARENPLWPQALEIFRYWQAKCSHPRALWTAVRFELIFPFLRDYGFDLCKRAIDGIAFDPFTTRRKNGTEKRHDGWHLVFRSPDHFEEYVNKAPLPAAAIFLDAQVPAEDRPADGMIHGELYG